MYSIVYTDAFCPLKVLLGMLIHVNICVVDLWNFIVMYGEPQGSI